MKYEEIDGKLKEMCADAVEFHNRETAVMEEITVALEEANGNGDPDTWESYKAVVDAYADGLTTIMNGLLSYAKNQATKDVGKS